MSVTSVPEPTIAQLPYPVWVGNDLRETFHAWCAQRSPSSVIVLCDEKVHGHARAYAAGLSPRPTVVPIRLGERRKRLRTVEDILETLASKGIDRRSLIVGVGGGVAGDLFGFVASCYMRGVAFANIATTVVAMVDASIGGKTGVDLKAGKNLAGAFSDPAAVFAPLDTLKTLSPRHHREGLAEVVKHAILDGGASFVRLEQLARTPLLRWPRSEIITHSMRVKADIVINDRLESGRRELLNLGHTFAHGIEHASGFRITHGAAVAIGLRAAGLLGQRERQYPANAHQRTLRLLTRLGLPVWTDRVSVREVLDGMMVDKKNRAGSIRFVIPQNIGNVAHGVTADPTVVKEIVTMITRPPKRLEQG